MRALRYDGHGVTLDASTPEPAPRPGEALVRPLLVGLVPDDGAFLSAHSLPPFTLGRELVGVVESLAGPREESARWVGKRIVSLSTIPCGACDLCRGGAPAHCRAPTRVGVPGGLGGCLADRIRLPVAALLPVPDHVEDADAILAPSVAAAAHASRVVRAEGTAFVTVLGDSLLGLLAGQVLARLNASVRVLGDDPARAALCEKWGLKHRPIAEAGRRQDQGVVLECTGTPQGLEVALRLVRPRGKVVLTRPVAGDLSHAVAAEVELIGASAVPLQDGLALLARGEVQTPGLITRRFKLADAVKALHAAADPRQLKVVVEIDGR